MEATQGSGRYLKAGSSADSRMMSTTLPMSAEILDLAPLLMLRAVRARAAVAGMPPSTPEKMLAMPMDRTSLRWLNLVLVILAAILAEMRVSSTATKAMDSDAWKKSMHVEKTAAEPQSAAASVVPSARRASPATQLGVKRCCGKTGGSTRLAEPKLGYRVDSVWMRYEMAPLALRLPQIMPMAAMMTAQGMAMPRILGRMEESTSWPKKKKRKITTACHSHRPMCASCSATLSRSCSWRGSLGRPRAKLSWLTQMMMATPTEKPCITDSGTNCAHLSRLSQKAPMHTNPVMMASSGSTSSP
mmetsp:Transcript_41337/g.110606  ORF Transcript_41337/g.110606 Transcript_41337/m.110606 type:complete len:302 (-) Transcript_41337:574-1479(-)